MKIIIGVKKKTYHINWKRFFRIKNVLIRNLLSEFFATGLLRYIGSGGQTSVIVGKNDLLQINFIWGFAVTSAVYTAWKSSGGHINPAITAILCLHGFISVFHAVLYCIAQICGAFVGAALSYGVHREAILSYGGGVLSAAGENISTGAIFASFPGQHLSNFGAFVDQFAGTALLGIFIAFFCERRNQIPLLVQPILYGCVATLISISYGLNMGSPINPATDLGSRMLAAAVGYGAEMFTYHNYFFWIPVIAPMIGGPFGAAVYRLFIGHHLPDTDQLPK